MDNALIIRMRLEHDDEFALKCLLILHEKQEADEQAVGDAMHRNGQGFNKQDAPELSSYVDMCKPDSLMAPPPSVLQRLHELLPKYANQLSRYLTDEEVME